VPDWPTSFGSWYKIPKLVGGVKFEHTHRMIAQDAGLLTIVLAVWTWRVEKRRWMRLLAYARGGHGHRSGDSGRAHGSVLSAAGSFFGARHAGANILLHRRGHRDVHRRKWVEEQPRVEFDQRRPSLFTLTLLSIFVLYVQLILGGMFRHHGLSWWPHVVHAASCRLCWRGRRCARSDGLFEY
jgi:heme A synthase